MKRIVAILMVLSLLICGAATGESGKGSDEAVRVLRRLSIMYRSVPSEFSTENMIKAYMLYNMYPSMKAMEVVESLTVLPGAEGDAIRDIVKGYEEMKSGPDEAFNKWLNGEITDVQCKEEVMRYVDILIKSIDSMKTTK